MTWNALDKTACLQPEHHLVHRWGRNLEVSLHIGLGRGDAVDLRVVEDERQVLPLFRGIRLARHCCPIVQDPCEDRQKRLSWPRMNKPIQGQPRHSKVETTRNIYMQTVDPETWRAVVNLEELVEPKKGKPKSK